MTVDDCSGQRGICAVTFTLDIGGEGRHRNAWNLNPSAVRTLGPIRGEPIPRRIPGRAEEIPLPDNSVDCIIMERTPLRRIAIHEIARVIRRDGKITLIHAMPPNIDPHLLPMSIIPGNVTQRRIRIGRQTYQETEFHLGETPSQPSNATAPEHCWSVG